jgi:hypothetical protein
LSAPGTGGSLTRGGSWRAFGTAGHQTKPTNICCPPIEQLRVPSHRSPWWVPCAAKQCAKMLQHLRFMPPAVSRPPVPHWQGPGSDCRVQPARPGDYSVTARPHPSDPEPGVDRLRREGGRGNQKHRPEVQHVSGSQRECHQMPSAMPWGGAGGVGGGGKMMAKRSQRVSKATVQGGGVRAMPQHCPAQITESMEVGQRPWDSVFWDAKLRPKQAPQGFAHHPRFLGCSMLMRGLAVSDRWASGEQRPEPLHCMPNNGVCESKGRGSGSACPPVLQAELSCPNPSSTCI